MREGAVAVEREAKSGILDRSRQVAVSAIQVCDPLLKRDRWRKSVGVLNLRGNKSRRDPASSGQRIDALAIVEDMQKETRLPIAITNRARGHVLTVEELRRLANLERSRAHRNYPR
jgi:hypothetical protein